MASAGSVTPKKGDTGYDDEKGKIIRDPVHGLMYFSEPIVKIMDTVEVQRLREIRQLGATYLVYPGASHTCFDHALGTSFLCEKMLRSLKERDADNRITDHDVLLVQIAGLCHDLAQGPFARVYRHTYLGIVKHQQWDPNQSAIEIFQIIINREKVKDVFKKYNISEDDIEFIKYAMTGVVPEIPKKDRFLYEIVRNKKNGIDCNAFDSLLRDSFFLGIGVNFDYKLYVLSTSIKKVDKEYIFCVRHKENFELDLLFQSLRNLQHKAYRHKTVTGIEVMLAEILREAEDIFDIFEARNNPSKLLKLTDNIITRIEYSEDKRLAKAQDIIQRIKERQLYRFCGQTSPIEFINDEKKHNFSKEVTTAIISKAKANGRKEEQITEDDIFIDFVDIGSEGMFAKPHFVNKYGKPVTSKNSSISTQLSPTSKQANSPRSQPECNAKEQTDETMNNFNKKINQELPMAGQMQMQHLENQFIRAYSRDEKKKDAIINGFHAWCKEKEFPFAVDTEKVPQEHEDEIVVAAADIKSPVRRQLFKEGTEDSEENH